MKAFLRALRYAWPYRYRIVLGWVCGFAAAVLWAGSITAVLPLFDLLFGEAATAVRYVAPPKADPADWLSLGGEPPDRDPYLEVPADWQSVPDASVGTFAVDGTTVRHAPGLRVIRRGEGLRGLADQAREEGDFYAPALAYLAGLLPADRFASLLWVMVAVMVMAVARSALVYISQYVVGHAAVRAVLGIQLRAFDHVLRSRLARLAGVKGTDVLSRFQSDCRNILDGLKTLLGKVVVEPPRVVLCLGLAVAVGVAIDPLLPVIVLVAAPLVGWLVQRFAKRMRTASRKSLESRALQVEILEESLFGLRVVKSYRLEGHQRRRFFTNARRLLKQLLRTIRIDAATGPVVEALFTVAVAVAIIYGGHLIVRQGVSAAKLTYFFALLVGAADPVRKLSNVSNRLQQAASGAERVWHLLGFEAEPRYGTRGTCLPRHQRDIVFRNVAFEYVAGKPVLRGINLEVAHGEVIAIIGRTGCGKTSLVSLIPRFFEPAEGAILVDGTDLADVTLRSLRDQVAYVPQDDVLFAETVATNIALGAPEAARRPPPRDAVEAAARAAYADAFIRALPEGYDTRLGERGTTLSGGERQRLSLARAILRDPAILILDEATSALDEETQAQVQETLRTVVQGRTTFLIAHRLSTLTIADRIVVMEAGRIEAVGTHAELLESCPTYRRLREVGLDGL